MLAPSLLLCRMYVCMCESRCTTQLLAVTPRESYLFFLHHRYEYRSSMQMSMIRQQRILHLLLQREGDQAAGG